MRLLVLGNPVDHSLSPILHNAALAACGLSGSFGYRNVDAIGMHDAVAEMRRGELSGASVTMPHKGLAAELADRLSTAAKRAGAVNTFVSANDVVGHNTDIVGIRSAWAEARLDQGAPARILGTGGAAAAALLALEGRDIRISGRRPAAAAALLDRIGVDAEVVDWMDPAQGSIVINATPIGMNGDSLPSHLLEDMSGLFDMAYGPVPTPAVVWAGKQDIPCADGPAMLLHQAAAAFQLWTGFAAPLTVMREALNRR